MVIVEDDAGWQALARYVDLNPVRIEALRLNKRQRVAGHAGAIIAPPAESVAERLRRLREFRWSSYRSYARYGAGVGWLWRDPLERLCGGRSQAERRAALRNIPSKPCARARWSGPGMLGVDWPQIVKGLERVKGERWAQFSVRHGDWGRDAALWLGRKRGRYSLSQRGQLAGGMDYAAVGQAVSQFGQRLEREPTLRAS